MLAITGFYASLFTLLLIWLTWQVIARRKTLKVAHGTAGDDQLERRRNAHSNFVECVPFALILMATAEASNTTSLALHSAGIALIIGRISHAIGMTAEPENFKLRQVGMILTFLSLITLSAINLLRAFEALVAG